MAENGSRWADHRSFYWIPGQTGIRYINAYDASKGMAFQAHFQKPVDAFEEFKTLEIRNVGGPQPIYPSYHTALQGLYWANTVEWLPERLANSKCELVAIEPLFDARCAKIVALHSNSHGGDTNVDVLWLDLEHDCLPRRYHQLGSKFDSVVDELQQLNSGLWFPKRARLQLPSEPAENQLVIVTEVEVNQPADAIRFYPPTPEEGTRVTDHRNGGENQTKSQRRQAGAEPAPAAATPSSRVGLTTIIFISVSVLAVGLLLRRQ